MGGPLTLEEIIEAKEYNDIKYFVETGTYKADTTLLVSPFFDQVYSTEIHIALYNDAVMRAKQNDVTNVEFLFGNSISLLKDITPKVKEGAVFFLDAHISGADSGWDGKHRVPIFEELDVILREKLGPSVFIVDDLRLWKQKVWDWAHVTNEKILQKFEDCGYEVQRSYEKNDRFYVFTK